MHTLYRHVYISTSRTKQRNIPPINQGVENERHQIMVRVELIDLEPQRTLVHVHVIPDLLGLLVVHIRRRRQWRRLRDRDGRRPNPGPPAVVVIGCVIGDQIGAARIVGGIVNRRGWVRRIGEGSGRRVRIRI